MDDFEKFYNSSLKFLSYRPRSEKEVRNKLKTLIKRHSGEQSEFRIDSGVANAPENDRAETVIEKIISKLKKQNFINDEEFAKGWIENRIRFKPRSLRLIKLELKQKGISEEIIHNSLLRQGFGGQAEFIIQNDLEQAKRLVEKRLSRYKGLDRRKIYEKLGRYLASKGFDWNTVKKSIDEVLEKGV